jgi:AAA+ superfamily predicted ATPase
MQLLDQALYRRFDDILYYDLPNTEEIEKLISNRLGLYKTNFSLKPIVEKAKGLSHAEISRACLDSIKETVLSEKTKVTKELLLYCLQERQTAYKR